MTFCVKRAEDCHSMCCDCCRVGNEEDEDDDSQ